MGDHADTSERVPLHAPILQPGSLMCICGQRDNDYSVHPAPTLDTSDSYPPIDGLDPYVDRDDLGADTLLLDADIAAEQVANLISWFTNDEVDGDGDPWSIALSHLADLVHSFSVAVGKFPEVAAWVRDEYGDDVTAAPASPLGEVRRG